MNTNPYDPAIGDLKPVPKPPQAKWLLTLKRCLLLCAGFVALFAVNAIVELAVLPNWGLENTRDNNVYFMCWWIAVGFWFIFGIVILAAPMRSENSDE